MFSALLLAWYDRCGRVLPFRGTKDPYRIWVSEIMLQQTRTETVGAYYARFLSRFPDVFALAAAPEEDVLKCWEGLGYYSRARNLHRAAREVAEKYHGRFPADPVLLRALPGIGDYTAAAVASIAFDLPVPAVDGNLTRVLARFHGVREDVGQPSVKRRLDALARQDMPPVRCGDFNQALMDLGATVCVPGTPDCPRCPLRALCDACAQGDADALPVKAAAKPPREIPLAVAIVTCHGRVWMEQRTETLLKGLWVYQLTEGCERRADAEKQMAALGIRAACREELGHARHVFTHRVWQMTLFHYAAETEVCRAGRFFTRREMDALPIPTAMKAARAEAERLLTPRVLPASGALLPQAAAAYAAGWADSHAAHCSPAFLKKHSPGHMEETLRTHLAHGRGVYALQIAGETAGVLVLSPQDNEVTALYVRPEEQGLGIGKAAMAFAVDALDKKRPMKVTVLTRNEKAKGLYAAFGFTRIGETRILDAARDVAECDLYRPPEP